MKQLCSVAQCEESGSTFFRFTCGVGMASTVGRESGFVKMEKGGIGFSFPLCKVHGEDVQDGKVVDVDFARLVKEAV